MTKVNQSYGEVFIEGVSLKMLNYIYKSKKCERIISNILKDVLNKNKKSSAGKNTKKAKKSRGINVKK